MFFISFTFRDGQGLNYIYFAACAIKFATKKKWLREARLVPSELTVSTDERTNVEVVSLSI